MAERVDTDMQKVKNLPPAAAGMFLHVWVDKQYKLQLYKQIKFGCFGS